jgi:radical SAM superfamily enzyme YgiQ (UPF0313 family)
MKILLTHGYFIADDKSEQRIMKPYPPLGLLYLSAWLKKEGYTNDIYDSTFGNLEALKRVIEKHQPDVVGIYSTLMTKSNVLKIILFIKENPILNHTAIVIGGPDSRHHARNYLSHGVDVIIPGEAEQTLTETIKVLEKGDKEGLSKINGIVFSSMHGDVITTPQAKQLDLDELPFPSRGKIDMHAYLTKWKTTHGYSSINVNTMRGCPYSCNWCSKAIFGNTSRRRKPDSVVKEMIQLRDQYQPDQIWFTDDVFTINRKWLDEFNKELIRQKVLIPYECISRSDCLDDQILDLLKSSGCKKIWIGAESGSQKVIDLMDRKINIANTISIINQSREKGISTGTFIMLGYPGETKRDIVKTAEYLKKALPDELTIGLAYPISGTKLFEQVKNTLRQPYNWETTTEREIVFKRTYSERFYHFALRYLHYISLISKARTWKTRSVYRLKAFLARVSLYLLN